MLFAMNLLNKHYHVYHLNIVIHHNIFHHFLLFFIQIFAIKCVDNCFLLNQQIIYLILHSHLYINENFRKVYISLHYFYQ